MTPAWWDTDELNRMEVIYQRLALKTFYPAQAAVIAVLLSFVSRRRSDARCEEVSPFCLNQGGT